MIEATHAMADAGKEDELAGVKEDIDEVRRDLKDLRGERDEVRKKAEADQDKERLKERLKEIKSEIREKEALLRSLTDKEVLLLQAATGGAPAAGSVPQMRPDPQLINAIADAVVARTRGPQSSVSLALMGQQAIKCAVSKPYTIEDGESLVPAAIDGSVRENEVMAVIFPALQQALNAKDESLILGNSQEHKWLPQDPLCPPKNFLKPDGFVLYRAFFASGGHKPADERLFGCIRSLVEGKFDDAHGTEAMGQAQNYAQKLQVHVTILHVLLVDKAKFRAARFYSGNLDVYVDGRLSDKGTANFLSSFLLGAGRGRMEDDYRVGVLAIEPQVTDLEKATNAALRHWQSKGLSLCEGAFLGMGLTGIVLAMILPATEDGADDGEGERVTRSKAQGTPVAVKIVLEDFIPNFEREVRVHDKLGKNPCHSELIDPSIGLHDGIRLGTGIVTPVAEYTAASSDQKHLLPALKAVATFHKLGWIHGDARMPNVAYRNSKAAFLIDLSHSVKSDERLDRLNDFGMLLCSWLRIKIEHEKGWQSALRKRGHAKLEKLLCCLLDVYESKQQACDAFFDGIVKYIDDL
eukprot:m.149221 g.149221  ORF g.149221 m.149221 type:complete len:580 (+) comp11669_c0_seq26:35-1774(+)